MWVLLLLTLVISTETLICGSDLSPSDFSSKSAMEANGWVFSWTGNYEFWPNTYHCDGIPSTSYCGWELTEDAVGELSLTLNLSGYSSGWVNIDYGDNWRYSGTSLFVNGELLDSTTTTSRTFSFAFADGDVLMLAESGVMLINNITFNCSEICNSPINTNNITNLSITGWYKDPTEINYENGGLVGGWYRELFLEWTFLKTMTIVGAKTDYDINPYYIYYGTDFGSVTTQITGSKIFDEEIIAQKVRVKWDNTEGSKGFHFQFLGCETATEDPFCVTNFMEVRNLVSTVRKGTSSRPCYSDGECSIYDKGAQCSAFICSCSDGSKSPPPCMV